MSVLSPEQRVQHNATYYAKNKKKVRAATMEAAEKRRNISRAYIIDYLSKHPCIDCGEDDIIVLEFDHIDRSTKEANVATMMRDALSLHRVIAEIEKCVVRCANCHRRKTYEEMGYTSRSYPHHIAALAQRQSATLPT